MAKLIHFFVAFYLDHKDTQFSWHCPFNVGKNYSHVYWMKIILKSSDMIWEVILFLLVKSFLPPASFTENKSIGKKTSNMSIL